MHLLNGGKLGRAVEAILPGDFRRVCVLSEDPIYSPFVSKVLLVISAVLLLLSLGVGVDQATSQGPSVSSSVTSSDSVGLQRSSPPPQATVSRNSPLRVDDSPAATGPEEGIGPEFESPTESRSVGATNRGRLYDAAALEADDSLFLRNPNARYGTEELVSLLNWARAQVDATYPGSRLVVGDLSRRGGRRLRPHRSHRAGRDADVGFYLLNDAGEPAMNERFVRLSRHGTGSEPRSERELVFDDARNWEFIAALLGQDRVPVQYIMVISPLRERILAEGERRGAPEWLLNRVREVVGPRATGRGPAARFGTHYSHFHVRIYCAPDDRPRCQDMPPYWDWVPRPSRQARIASRSRMSRARMSRIASRSRMSRTRMSSRSRMRPRRGRTR